MNTAFLVSSSCNVEIQSFERSIQVEKDEFRKST